MSSVIDYRENTVIGSADWEPERSLTIWLIK